MLRFIFHRPVGFLLSLLVLVGAGIVVITQLPVMMYPQTRRPQVQVNLSHPGISALDFQEQYAERIEPRLQSLEGLDLLETTYSTDNSSFVLTFQWEIPPEEARTQVQNLLSSLNSALPEEIRDSWSVRSREGENAGYLVMGLTSASTPPEELYRLLEETLGPEMDKIPDVEEITLNNTRQLTVDIKLDQRKMLAYGLTILDVNTALQAGFVPSPLGSLNTSEGRLSLRLQRQGRSLQGLTALEVKKVGDSTVSLDDIAQVDIRYALPGRVFLVKDRPAVQLTAQPVEGGNVNQLTHQVRTMVDQVLGSGRLPEDTEYFFYLDPAKYIQRSIDNVVQSALLGGLLAVLMVLLVLGEMRNTLIIAASIPLSLVFSFLLMGAFGMSLNLISLGGLALAVGMIVDATIVVMENIHRHRLETPGKLHIQDWQKMVLGATAQVRSPVIASTVTSVLVFLPISFTSPLTNAILGDQARTVVFALSGSLVVSLTVVPLLAFYLYRGRGSERRSQLSLAVGSRRAMVFFQEIYRMALGWLIRRRLRAGLFLSASLGILAVSVLVLLPLVPREILPTPTSDRIVLFFRNSTVTEPEDLIRDVVPEMSRKIEEALGDRMVQKFANLSGRFNQIFIDLTGPSKTQEALDILGKIFISEGDWYYNILPWDPAALPLPNTFDFQLSVHGPDPGKKTEILAQVQALLAEKEFYRRAFTRPSTSQNTQLDLTLRASTQGKLPPWTESTLGGLIRRILAGTTPITLSDGQEEARVSAAYPKELVDSQADLEDFLVPFQQSFVPLKHFFQFSRTSGVSQVFSEDGEPVYRVYGFAGPQISDPERLALQAQAEVYLRENLKLPEGYSYTFDNPREEMDRAIGSLFLALGISVMLMYLFLVFQFNSLGTPLIILVTIPLGLTGVILSLWLFGSTINLNSLLGTILLGGIVVNNAIIMIDFFLASRHDYPDKREALLGTAVLRFQPILITTLTTVIGMLPLALGLGEGANILQPLGIVVSGGLTVSTLFTLFAVPALIFLTQKDHHLPRENRGVV